MRTKLLSSACVLVVLMGCGGGSSSATTGPGKNEGTEAEPLTLALGRSHAGGVAAGGVSYYRFIPDQTRSITVRFDELDGGDLFVTVQPDSPVTGAAAELLPLGRFLHNFCNSVTSYGHSRRLDRGFECVLAVAAGHPYVLKVSNEIVSFAEGGTSDVAATSYQMTVLVDPSSQSQGSLEAPIMVTPDVPHVGTSDLNDYSFYSFIAEQDLYQVYVMRGAEGSIDLAINMVGPDGQAMPCEQSSCGGVGTIPGQRYVVIVSQDWFGADPTFTLHIESAR